MVILLIKICTALEYDFKKIDNTTCTIRGEGFETLDEAEAECKSSKQCQGVVDIECKGIQSYICSKNESISSNIEIESCFYEKYAIGKHNMKQALI